MMYRWHVPAAKRPGRPRSTPRVDLLVSVGVDGVTFDEVAVCSGVAKTTLYRHFGSKQAMVVAAATSCFEELPTPDTGDLREDLRTIFDRWKPHDHAAEAERVHDLLPVLLAAGDRDPELRALVVAMLEERRRPIRTVLRLAQLRGEIGPDVDLDLMLALVLGPFVQRRLVDRDEITDEFRDAVLDHVVVALRATAPVAVG